MTVRIVLNRRGIRQLLQDTETVAPRAERIQAAAGPGHEMRVEVGRNRARAVVYTATFEAREAQATGENLSRSIDAGR